MSKNTVNFTKEDIKIYLDTAIRNWRKSRDSGNEMSVYYIDAFQSVRLSIFGETLPESPTETVK